jgi:hypothetical protein
MGIKVHAALQAIAPDPSVHVPGESEITARQMSGPPFDDCLNLHPTLIIDRDQLHPINYFLEGGQDIYYLNDFDITLTHPDRNCIFLPARRCYQ